MANRIAVGSCARVVVAIDDSGRVHPDHELIAVGEPDAAVIAESLHHFEGAVS